MDDNKQGRVEKKEILLSVDTETLMEEKRIL
jgi:hypothetical protein